MAKQNQSNNRHKKENSKNDNNFQYGIGKYFEGKVLDGEKVIYKGDVRDIILSDVKNRRVLNFERKENFIYKNTLYLYDGLDVTIKELKKEIIC